MKLKTKGHIIAKIPLPLIKMCFMVFRGPKFNPQKWTILKKIIDSLSDPDETENIRTYYRQNATSTFKKVFSIGV